MELIKRYKITRKDSRKKSTSVYVDSETLATIMTVQQNTLPTDGVFDTQSHVYEFNGMNYADPAEAHLLGNGDTYSRQIAIRRPSYVASKPDMAMFKKSLWHLDEPEFNVQKFTDSLTEFRKQIREKIQRALSATQPQ